MWKKNDEGVILDERDNPIFIPIDVFKNLCASKGCFICGAAPAEREFNNEHVIPRWILKEHNLFDASLTLPNGQNVKYSTYKLRCCKTCNTRLAENFETPVSKILRQHNKGKDLNYEDKFLIYRWMALLVLKTHLMDRFNPNQLNQLTETGKIADSYDWSLFHHIHALARSKLNDVLCDAFSFGTFFFLPFRDISAKDSFDYADLLQGRCVMLRLNDTCYFAALDDGGHCGKHLRHIFERIDGPINTLQARELLTDPAFVRAHLSEEPSFSTITHLEQKKSAIVGRNPDEDVNLIDLDFSVRAKILEFCISGIIDNYTVTTVEGAVVNDTNFVSYLFDENGNFKKDAITLKGE